MAKKSPGQEFADVLGAPTEPAPIAPTETPVVETPVVQEPVQQVQEPAAP